MANDFEEFVNFVWETTGRHPEFAASFKDVYIYVPRDKTPPEAEESTPRRTVSIKNYFSNRSKEFVDCVYNEDWHRLEDHLGPQLLRFCLTECIFARKTKTGAFVVSKLTNLQSKIPRDPPRKLNVIRCATDKEKLSVASYDNGEITTDLSHLLCPTELEITTDHLLRRNARSPKFPPGHTLLRPVDKTPLSSQVLNQRVGNFELSEYQDCLQPLHQLLNKFKKNHRTYQYEMWLDREILSHAMKSGGGLNSGNQIPVSVLKKYFGHVMSTAIPNALYGSRKNQNVVIQSICELLETSRGESMNLIRYISKMRVWEIGWIQGVKNINAQWCILAKLVKWLYHKFILELIATQLYVTPVDSNRKIYFKQGDWKQLTTKFLRKMREETVIARSDGIVTKMCCEGRWLIFPKKNGVRPIMSPIKGSEPREATAIALCYLQQLYITKYGTSGNEIFREKWRNLVENFQINKHKTKYLVCCDIQNAFESIDQKKLFAIVKSLAASTGPELCRKWYRVARNLDAVKSKTSKVKQYFAYPELELPVASKSIFACASEKVVTIGREAMLREIRRNILNQNILVAGQRYLLQKGIPQGAMLSSVLCDIYYADMEETSLSEFRDQGFLYRYVDDYLFVTEDKALAERFLQRVHTGFPEYNCSFNPAKTRTNLEPKGNAIPFLGFNIDPHTFEVSSDYSRSTRYTTMLSKPRYQIMETFRKRLSNLATLKLNGIILDRKINSRKTIMDNIKRVFIRQAERCLWLLKALFDDIPSHRRKIFRIMKATNLRIVGHIQRYFLANGYTFEDLLPFLSVIPWKAYRQAFGKMQPIHVYFRELFLRHIKVIEGSIAMARLPPAD